MTLDSKMEIDPPFADCFCDLFKDCTENDHLENPVGECELPVIDLGPLCGYDRDRKHACIAEVVKAASEWGFFQVVNHGISPELLEDMKREQFKLFALPFEKKVNCRLLNDSYRWGTPTAKSLPQFSWSEAFHVPLSMISNHGSCYGEFNSMREVMEKFATAVSKLAILLAGILAENLLGPKQLFEDNCNKNTCFLRFNRYPTCSFSPEVFGLVPHTDSDFLTILHQDQVGGLHLLKDSRWVAVRPNPSALTVNIGDLFQAYSNGVYKSVEHKVMVNRKRERYSIAYFLCPSYDTMIQSCMQPSLYKTFTFGEYRKQVQEDVKKYGHKVGLPRFLR